MKKIVLFDRDGTLIFDPKDLRVKSLNDIELFPDSIKSLKLLADNGYEVVLITNQAGIAEGIIDFQEFETINSEVIKQLESSGIKILKTYMCPHGTDDSCDCRKPSPKMVLEALSEYNLNPSETFFVGDRISDVEAGNSAGCKTILVKTANEPQPLGGADFETENLYEAVRLITGETK